jgi:protein-tyrosine-phosphatase
MKIHFVCSGNFFRSRLAEAYLNSKRIPTIAASSSGLISEQEYNNNGPISWYAMRLIKNNNLIPFMKKLPDQTTPSTLASSDFVIFMTEANYLYAKEHFGFDKDTYEVWDIADLDQFNDNQIDLNTETERIKATEKIYVTIKEKVDGLIRKLR